MPERSLPDETDAPDALLEYCLTMMVLSLVLAINGGRHVAPEFEPPLEKSQSPRRQILNAFANIAVHGPEVVAVTTSSVWKSGPRTGKRLGLDQTQTD